MISCGNLGVPRVILGWLVLPSLLTEWPFSGSSSIEARFDVMHSIVVSSSNAESRWTNLGPCIISPQVSDDDSALELRECLEVESTLCGPCFLKGGFGQRRAPAPSLTRSCNTFAVRRFSCPTRYVRSSLPWEFLTVKTDLARLQSVSMNTSWGSLLRTFRITRAATCSASSN